MKSGEPKMILLMTAGVGLIGRSFIFRHRWKNYQANIIMG